MKKILIIIALTIATALSMEASAQSLIGKWRATSDQQTAIFESMGAEIEKTTSVMNFDKSSMYIISYYTRASIDIMDIKMHMSVKCIEKGFWSCEDSVVTMTPKYIDFVEFDVTFSDPDFNYLSKEIEDSVKKSLQAGLNLNIPFKLSFNGNNKATLLFDNELAPLEYKLTRIEYITIE